MRRPLANTHCYSRFLWPCSSLRCYTFTVHSVIVIWWVSDYTGLNKSCGALLLCLALFFLVCSTTERKKAENHGLTSWLGDDFIQVSFENRHNVICKFSRNLHILTKAKTRNEPLRTMSAKYQDKTTSHRKYNRQYLLFCLSVFHWFQYELRGQGYCAHSRQRQILRPRQPENIYHTLYTLALTLTPGWRDFYD